MSKEVAVRENNFPANLENLTKFVLIGQEKLNSVRAEIRAIDKLGLATEVKDQKQEEASMLAGALLDAEVKIGELISRMPPQSHGEKGKFEEKLPKGITPKQSSAFQTMAENKDIVEEVKAEAEENDDLPTRTEVLRRIKEKEKIKQATENNKKEIEELPPGKFIAILADPPWSYDREVGQGVAADQYPTLSLEEIKSMPVKDIAANNSFLFIWVTFPQLKNVFEVIDAWGFEYKTVAFTWVKTNKNNEKPLFGIGSYFKSNAEICLLAIKGEPHKFVKDYSLSSVIISPSEGHSRKPQEVRLRIEELLGDVPRIELFAREDKQVEGWTLWGNQSKNYKQ